jgi:CTP synthase (UTP-ammonia lyase)
MKNEQINAKSPFMSGTDEIKHCIDQSAILRISQFTSFPVQSVIEISKNESVFDFLELIEDKNFLKKIQSSFFKWNQKSCVWCVVCGVWLDVECW